MKTTFFIFAVLSFISIAVARPRNNYHHVHRLEKRAFVTEVTTVVVPKVINWVDSTGRTVTIETKGQVYTHKPAQQTLNNDIAITISYDTPTTVSPTVTNIPPSVSTLVSEPTPTTQSKPTESKVTEVRPTEVTTEVKPTIPKPTEPKTTSVETLVSTKPPSAPETTHEIPTPTPLPPKGPAEKWFSGLGFGICYAPYAADGKCKTQDQVYSDFAKLHDYGIVRSYGVDCNQIAMMLNAAKRYNKKVMLGLFTIQNVNSDLNTFITAAKDNWSYIYAVAIGNEIVNTGKASAHDLTNAVTFSRTILRSKGYTGPVVAVDTVNAMVAHPEICQASDFCAVNIHPFFDPHTSATEAGKFVRDQAKAVSNAVHKSKRVIVTETGWPHGGDHNGKAIPSRENQHIAIESLKQAFKGTSGELFLFSAFDDPWKKDGPNTFGAEKFWGIQ